MVANAEQIHDSRSTVIPIRSPLIPVVARVPRASAADTAAAIGLPVKNQEAPSAMRQTKTRAVIPLSAA